MNAIYPILQSIGLQEKEIKIYLASLSLGQTTASVLANKSGLARSTSQYTCNILVEKGLLNLIEKGNSFLYSPEDPEKLVIMANQTVFQAEQKAHNIHKIIGELKDIANPNTKLPKVKYYTGVEGIKNMFFDILQDKNTVKGYIYLGKKTNLEILNFFENEYIPKRKELGIKAYALSNTVENWSDKLKGKNNESRVLKTISRELYPIDTCIQIYGDKVSFCSLVDGDLTGIIIENKHIARTHLSCFEAIFHISDHL